MRIREELWVGECGEPYENTLFEWFSNKTMEDDFDLVELELFQRRFVMSCLNQAENIFILWKKRDIRTASSDLLYMAGSASRQDEVNSVFWLATRAGKMGLLARSGLPALVRPLQADL